MIRKIALLTVLVGASIAVPVVLAGAAGAQTYVGCTAVLSDTTPTPGQTITITGTGAGADEKVSATIDDVVIGTGVADANGNFQFSATIPTGISVGSHTVFVKCGSGGVLGVTIVVGAAGGGQGPLPTTGSSSTIPLLKLGVALIAIGAMVLALSRRRSHWVEDQDPAPLT
jgi:LPXTG-motif cell wall-anchored protein